MSEVHWAPACEIAGDIRIGKLSSLEYVRCLLGRITQLEPRLHAFVRLDAEGALEAASIADREIAAGRSRGALHGVPVGIKDVIDVAGLATTCHSQILAGNRASRDAHVVARLRAAGAIVIGKLSTHEFAFGGPSFDLPFPPARNPWDTAYHPGGSSSGAGVGLAAGLFPLAIGTDAAGSIRSPAGACGVVGLKPTYGLVSRQGAFPLAYTLDHVGPMARHVADIATVLEAIAGSPADAQASANASRYGADLELGVHGLRVGFAGEFPEAGLEPSPEMRDALADARDIMSSEGAQVRSVSLPGLGESLAVNRIILSCEAWALHRPWLRERPQDYGAATRRRLLVGAFHSAGDYIDAQRRRTEIAAQMSALFREIDVLLCPNSLDAPCRIDDVEATARTYPRQARAPFNLTGHPALVMMAGRSPAGLPLSVQFVGKHFDEATLLRAGRAYERATFWRGLHPSP